MCNFLTKKIIFSTTALSDHFRSKLLSISHSAYDIIDAKELSPTVAPNVEILLLSDNKWVNDSNAKQMTGLRFIQTLSTGVDSLDFGVIPQDVLVCGNVGAYAEPVSEHVFAMILCLAKNLKIRHDELRRSTFDKTPNGIFLKGKTIGIIGAGAIGQEVARLGKAFRMVTFGINTSGRKVKFFDKIGNLGSLNQLLSKSDVIVVSLPLTVKTLNLINESNLKFVKESCLFINVARGPIVNEKALYDHLREHPSFKAAFDVWWKYPAPGEKFAQNFPFFDLPNFLGSPHNADAVPESDDLALESAIANIERYLRRKQVKGLVDREDYLGLKSMIH
jgi:phosphoglycerate dehydrogenase-like enzyme